MTPEIRKFVTFDEEILIEGFKKADVPGVFLPLLRSLKTRGQADL